MSRTIIDIHILQTVPPSCLNRDDTGSPKTAIYGGTRRARVSSQAWKRATRTTFRDVLDPTDLGVRTRKLADALGEHIRGLNPDITAAESWHLAESVLKAVTGPKFKLEVPQRRSKENKESGAESAPESSYLVFLSERQLRGLAELAVEGRDDITAFLKDKKNQARAKERANTQHSVDIALFGRMVADGADINVDAAVQVAHAISVHATEIESDYFTAVDDRNPEEETGAGMIGTVDFASATLYRYAALDVDLLHRNLGTGLRDGEPTSEPVRRAVEAFVSGFVTSMPTGKINTFANHTLPDVVLVRLREARPVSFAGAFEKPVSTADGGYLKNACRALDEHIGEIERAYGAVAAESWLLRVGEATQALARHGREVSLEELIENVGAAVANRLEPRG